MADTRLSDDAARLRAVLAALGCPAAEGAVVTSVACEPLAKARPRFGSHRVYSDPGQKANQELLALHLRQAHRAPAAGNVAVACLFYRSTRQSIDTDNLLKQVLDAGNKIVWLDDSQVTAVAGVLLLDRDHPRVVVGVTAHDSSMLRGADAEAADKAARDAKAEARLAAKADRVRKPRTRK